MLEKAKKNSGGKMTTLWAITQRRKGNKSKSNPKLKVAEG